MREIPNLTQKQVVRFWAKVDKSKDCWEWMGNKDKYGYGRFWISDADYFAHRVSLKIVNDIKFNGLNSLHKCDNPSCVNPDHLFLGTQKDNMIDKVVKGRHRNRPVGTYAVSHPSITAYNHRGCRCIECKKIKSSRDKKYRQKSKYGITGQNPSI